MEDITREYAFESLTKGANNKKAICETLRMIYDEVWFKIPKEERGEVTELLVDALIMAKKMQHRLSYYQKTYKDNTGNKAKDIIGLTGVRARAKMRQERVV